ncbi:MAG: acyl-CoA carboxylase subunit beta [Christensenellales bacterium]|jgi:acetyl-CoA carboxylase carboxyltransferase component
MSETKKDLLAVKNEIIAGDEEKIAQQKKAGKLTARERINALLDAGSFVEIGALVKTKDDVGQSVVAGYGTVDARPAYVYAQDYTVKHGAMGVLQAKKIARVMELAKKTGAPLIAFLDSAGARVDEGAAVLDGISQVISGHAALSGIVPQIAVVSGPCVGTGAIAASLCDFVIMTDKVSSLLAQGAQIINAKMGKDVPAEELAGAKAAAKAGACAYAAGSEEEAIAAAQKLLAFMPSNNIEEAPVYEGENLNRKIDASGDVFALVSAIADGGEALELYKGYADEIFAGLVKLGGFCVGVIANNYAENGGVITPSGAAKAAKLIGVCDSFNIPVVSLVNTDGFDVGSIEDNFTSVQAGAKLAFAYAQATVPKVSVIVGKAIGGGYAVMGSKGVGADIVYAWPGAVIGTVNVDAGARILYSDEIRDGLSFQDAQSKYTEEYACPIAAAQAGVVDDVIPAEETRQHLIAAVDMLFSKREIVTPRKHGNAPL